MLRGFAEDLQGFYSNSPAMYTVLKHACYVCALQKLLVKHLFGGITTNNVVSLVRDFVNVRHSEMSLIDDAAS